MKTFTKNKAKTMNLLFGVLTLIAFITIAPHAFAQPSGAADDPHGPLEDLAWAVGMGTAGALSGFGVWTAVRRNKLH